MNPAESSDLNPASLVALRNDPDAMRIITERLKVKDMGPAGPHPHQARGKSVRGIGRRHGCRGGTVETGLRAAPTESKHHEQDDPTARATDERVIRHFAIDTW
jgi:hypothetical protein